jgi:hypothetical protein
MGKVEKIDSGANGEFVFSQITPLYTFSVKKCLDFLGSVQSGLMKRIPRWRGFL